MAIRQLLEHHQRQVNRKAWDDLRGFTTALESAGQLKVVHEAVDPRLQVTELCRRSLVANGPALLFENAGHDRMPVLGNLFGNEQRILTALETDLQGRPARAGQAIRLSAQSHCPDSLRSTLDAIPGFARLAHAATVRKESAPWQQNVVEGPDVDLATLPVTTCWPEDAGPLITWGMVITRGPNKPRVNLAIYRQQVIARNKVIMRWLPHRGGAQDFREFQQENPGQAVPGRCCYRG